MLGSHGHLRNDSRVSCLESLWLNESVLVSRNELSLVVGASITNHDLRRVLIWHHNSWLRKSAPEGIWVIWLKRLLQHTCMEVLSNFVLVLREGSYFGQSFAGEINWLSGTIIES